MERTCENCNTYNICKHKAKEEGNGCGFYSPAPTNADHIRNMSDEELAECLAGYFNCIPCGLDDKYGYFLEWLKQPRKVEKIIERSKALYL